MRGTSWEDLFAEGPERPDGFFSRMRAADTCPIDGPCPDCAWEAHRPEHYCLVGEADRTNRPLAEAVSEALDALLFRGVTPTMPRLDRAEAEAILLEKLCRRHRADATVALASLSPPVGLPRRKDDSARR